MPEDFADRHVRRWRDHWVDIAFDDATEAAVVRIERLTRAFRESKQAALLETGLQDFEYDTLHTLMIRDTPGQASPRDLARDLGISPAGLTGRLDGLEKAGWVKRTQSGEDRRKVDVEVTRSGAAVWRSAMASRGRAEEELMSTLSSREIVTLNRLLKKLTLRLESRAGDDA